MIHALRSTSRTPSFRPSPPLLPSRVAGTTSSIRFSQFSADKHPPEDMDKDKNLSEKTGRDLMSDSFGEGYASRSDDEGFGGIYGGNQSFPGTGEEKGDDRKKIIHENHPGPEEYDKNQGSEVKEKEKARHQTHVPTTTP